MWFAGDIGGYDSGGRGPYDDFWYGPVPGKTTSGVRVDDDTAMRLAVLYGCVNVISQDLAKVPLVMYRRRDDGGRERVKDHPVVKLLQNPARGMTSIDWRQREQAHQLLRGNAYCEIRTNFRGDVTELHPFRPDYVRTEVMANESLRYHVRNPGSGTEKIYVEGEILHMRGLSIDGPLGLSPIDQAKETLGEAVAAQTYGASFFANDARPSLWLEHPSHFKDEAQKKDWLSAFRRAFGASNRFSPMLTEYGVKIHNLPPVDHSALQFLELRKLKGNEICAIFRVPPHKVAILERSTNNNIEHQGIEYVTDCLLTWCRRWEERLALDLFTDAEREEYYLEFLLDALMRGDQKTRFESYQSGIVGGGWLTRNEVRKRENLDAMPGLDKPLEPLNMVPAGTQPAGAAKTPDTPAPTDSGAPSDDLQEARGLDLELQARRRVLNRETRALARDWERSAGRAEAFRDGVSTFYSSHATFAAEALALTRERAERYCFSQCEAIEDAIEAGAVPEMLRTWQANAEKLIFPPLPAAKPRKE